VFLLHVQQGNAQHCADKLTVENARYRAGEGIMGLVIEMDKPLIIRKLADEPRFLDKLGVYNPDLPFIAAPIRARGDEIVGVLAAHPPAELHVLGERRRFLEMIGNLIGQNVEAGWVQAKAARLLNMTPRQIAYRIQILNIQVRQI
jgi:Nif-specific regulatory protein